MTVTTLQPLEEVTISGRGETIVYLSGSEPLLISASGKRAEIPSGSQITFPTFDSVTIQNKGHSPVNANLLIVEGDFQSLAEGSTVRIQGINDPIEINEVQRIIEKVTAEISNTVDIRAITETLTAKISNTVDIREITETLSANVMNTVTAQISGLVSTQEKSANSILTNEKTFIAGESYTIAKNTNRRDLTVLADRGNTDIVRVAGMPLSGGQFVSLEKYTGEVTALAVAENDKIYITEVIK